MARVSLRSVSRYYGAVAAVDRVSIDIEEGEFVSLLGPSGCGKTTLLRCIAGFEPINNGEIRFDDQCVSGQDHFVPPEQRSVGMVFQSYALWPHMSVADNVAYPLRVQGVKKAEKTQRVNAMLDQVGMGGYARRRPAELSGGQRQRVALARCLVMNPRLVLLDEPLANLDIHLRESMQHEFRAIHQNSGTTMIYVTHDQAEAMALSDRIAVLNQGRLEQIDSPRKLFNQPATEMVAGFIGRGVVVDGRVTQPLGDGLAEATLLGVSLTTRSNSGAAGQAKFCLRPEWLTLCNSDDPQAITARVVDLVYRGGHTTLRVQPLCDERAPSLQLQVPRGVPRVGDVVHMKVSNCFQIQSV